jgi:hypothetical protein
MTTCGDAGFAEPLPAMQAGRVPLHKFPTQVVDAVEQSRIGRQDQIHRPDNLHPDYTAASGKAGQGRDCVFHWPPPFNLLPR